MPDDVSAICQWNCSIINPDVVKTPFSSPGIGGLRTGLCDFAGFYSIQRLIDTAFCCFTVCCPVDRLFETVHGLLSRSATCYCMLFYYMGIKHPFSACCSSANRF